MVGNYERSLTWMPRIILRMIIVACVCHASHLHPSCCARFLLSNPKLDRQNVASAAVPPVFLIPAVCMLQRFRKRAKEIVLSLVNGVAVTPFHEGNSGNSVL
jgi:hypothetical protein